VHGFPSSQLSGVVALGHRTLTPVSDATVAPPAMLQNASTSPARVPSWARHAGERSSQHALIVQTLPSRSQGGVPERQPVAALAPAPGEQTSRPVQLQPSSQTESRGLNTHPFASRLGAPGEQVSIVQEAPSLHRWFRGVLTQAVTCLPPTVGSRRITLQTSSVQDRPSLQRALPPSSMRPLQSSSLPLQVSRGFSHRQTPFAHTLRAPGQLHRGAGGVQSRTGRGWVCPLMSARQMVESRNAVTSFRGVMSAVSVTSCAQLFNNIGIANKWWWQPP
jgi:hypothetical protein